MIDRAGVREFPPVSATLTPNGSGTFRVGAKETRVGSEGSSEEDARAALLQLMVAEAARAGRPIRVLTTDTDGVTALLIAPDGSVEEDEATLREQPPARILTEQPAEQRPVAVQAAPAGVPLTRAATVTPLRRAATPTALPAPAEVAGPVGERVSERRQARASFLAEERKTSSSRAGWRGFLARVGLSRAQELEEAQRAERRLVSQNWPGPRTVSVTNAKGGSAKTPTTANLAAVFARFGGSGVLAWDNNETRGTLGWRTEQGPHDATVQDALDAAGQLLAPSARQSDIARFVHHQPDDKYDVLRSNPLLLATQQRISAGDFDRLHEIAARYYRLIFMDSGNDESAVRWLRMIDHTDQLVIATTALGEHAEAGALLLEALTERDERGAQLARDAVVIVSQSERSTPTAMAQRVADGFREIAREVVVVPYDPALHSGPLRFETLRPATQAAWLSAGAAVARGLL